MKILLALVLLAASTTYAQATAKTTLIFRNECEDLVNNDWTCLNRTQASQREEIFRKVWRASYNVKLKKPVTIISIDPIAHGKYIEGLRQEYQHVDYTFGAWFKHGVIYYADMPGCKNAQKKLQKLLKTLGYASK